MNGGIPTLTILLAAGIQINLTMPISESGLRVSVADLILPIAVVAIFASLDGAVWRGRQWKSKTLPLWIGGMTGVLILSFLIGYSRTGTVLPWAFYNKLVGWFVLMAYLMVGVCLVRANGTGAIDRFFTVFCLTAAVTAALSCIGFPILGQFNSLPILIQDFRLTGFLQNSNAFGFLIVVALCLALDRNPINHWLIVALLTALFFTSSRGAWLAGLGAMVVLFAVNKDRLRPLKKAIPWAIGAIVAIAGVHFLAAQLSSSGATTMHADRFNFDGPTVTQRVELGKLALQLFADSPVFGAGLGVFQQEAIAAGHPINGSTIHSSPLWLLTETGIVGLAIFTGFFVTCLRHFYQDRRNITSQNMLAIMVAFAIMACTGEFIYQRYLWLLFGMMIAVPCPDSVAKIKRPA